MAHFAQLDENNVVLAVVVVNNEDILNLPFPESEPVGIVFCKQLFGEDTNWKQTSYNSNFRKNYAVVGEQYREDLDGFVGSSPYSSWILNTNTCKWEAPIPYPNDGKAYFWDEPNLSWEVFTIPTNVESMP